jgi:hypothetical protein
MFYLGILIRMDLRSSSLKVISYQIAIESRLNSQIPSISYHRKRRINPLYLKITNLEFPSCWLAGVAWRGRAISFYAHVFVIGGKMYCARYNHTVLMPSIMWWSLQLSPSCGKNLVFQSCGIFTVVNLASWLYLLSSYAVSCHFVLLNTFYGPAHFYAQKLPNPIFVKILSLALSCRPFPFTIHSHDFNESLDA